MNLDWNALVAEMVATGEFHPAGLDATVLRRKHRRREAVIRTKGRRIIAYAARHKTKLWGCYEIQKVFVAKGVNGHGTAAAMIRELMAIRRRNKRFFLITKNPKLEHIVIDLGFEVRTKYNMPNIVEWAERTGLAEAKRLPDSATRDDSHHREEPERWLFMR